MSFLLGLPFSRGYVKFLGRTQINSHVIFFGLETIQPGDKVEDTDPSPAVQPPPVAPVAPVAPAPGAWKREGRNHNFEKYVFATGFLEPRPG